MNCFVQKNRNLSGILAIIVTLALGGVSGCGQPETDPSQRGEAADEGAGAGLQQLTSFPGRGTPAPVRSRSNPFEFRLRDQAGQDLGCWNCPPSHPDSVDNPTGAFGSPYRPLSIRNRYGFGNPHRPDSPCNVHGTSGPILFVFPPINGFPVISLNPTLPKGSCNPYAVEYSVSHCTRLQRLCS